MNHIDAIVQKVFTGKKLSETDLWNLADAATKWRGMTACFAADIIKNHPEEAKKVAAVMEVKLRTDITADRYKQVLNLAKTIAGK